MKLEQIYYGSNEKSLGYSCLNCSADGKEFVAFVEKVCAAIGTPDGFTKTKDFFVSTFYNNFCVMIKVFTGNKDFAGRSGALVFHALIGKKSDCKNYNITVASLNQSNYFNVQVSEIIESIEIKSPLSETEKQVLPANIFAAVNKNEKVAITTSEPLNKIGEAVCFSKELAYTKSFATMCYNSESELDIVCLSQEVSAPNNRKLFQPSGRMIIGNQAVQKKINQSKPENKKIETRKNKNKMIKLVLTISIILNIILGYNLLNSPKEKIKFEGKIIVNPTNQISARTRKNLEVSNFLDSASEYINFVNKNFVDKNKLNTKSKKESSK